MNFLILWVFSGLFTSYCGLIVIDYRSTYKMTLVELTKCIVVNLMFIFNRPIDSIRHMIGGPFMIIRTVMYFRNPTIKMQINMCHSFSRMHKVMTGKVKP